MKFNLSLFPAFESPYCANKLDSTLALSILAVHLQFVMSPSNALFAERAKSHFFFRNHSVPLPRPATILAWNLVCRIGIESSPYYLLPFLPSLRMEDETGDAIQMLGTKVPSLSRKSTLHHRDDEKRIIWGPLYIAKEGRLLHEYDRSNITESQLQVPMKYVDSETKLTPVRHRMEFFGSHGIPIVNAFANELKVPTIKRLLLQFTDRESAEAWAAAYFQVDSLVKLDHLQVESDFRLMLTDEHERRKNIDIEESKQDDNTGKLGKFSSKAGRFGDLEGISFDF